MLNVCRPFSTMNQHTHLPVCVLFKLLRPGQSFSVVDEARRLCTAWREPKRTSERYIIMQHSTDLKYIAQIGLKHIKSNTLFGLQSIDSNYAGVIWSKQLKVQWEEFEMAHKQWINKEWNESIGVDIWTASVLLLSHCEDGLNEVLVIFICFKSWHKNAYPSFTNVSLFRILLLVSLCNVIRQQSFEWNCCKFCGFYSRGIGQQWIARRQNESWT